MNEKDIKRMLNNHNLVCAEIHQLEQDILNLADVVAAHRDLSAITYSDMPSSGKISDPTFEKAQRIIDEYKRQVERIELRISILFEKKNQVEAFLEPLSEIEREIIRLRFFKRYRWDMVARTVNYSKRQCENILEKLLIKFIINKTNI